MANVKATDLIDFTRASTGTYLDSDGTLKTAANNIPRIEYDADGNLLGLLIEESRTNNYQYSEDFSNSYYNVKIRTRTLEATQTGPDGATSAYVFGDDNSGGTETIILGKSSVALVTNTTYTWSIFAKKDGLNWIALSCVDFGGITNGFTHFDLENGAVGSTQNNITAKIQEYPNDWYRCSVTFTTDGTDATGNLYLYMAEADNDRTVDLDGTSSILIYGAQFEAGSFPTSYIKTQGSTVSRSADVASIDVDQFGYNQSEGTVTVEAKTFSNVEANHGDFALTDGATSPDLMSGSRTGSSVAGTYSTWYRTNGITQANLVRVSAVEDNVFYKAGFCYKANDFAQSVDGGSILSDSSGTVPSRNSVVLIGDNYYGKLNGHIKSLTYTPKRLSNAKLQELTS